MLQTPKSSTGIVFTLPTYSSMKELLLVLMKNIITGKIK